IKAPDGRIGRDIHSAHTHGTADITHVCSASRDVDHAGYVVRTHHQLPLARVKIQCLTKPIPAAYGQPVALLRTAMVNEDGSGRHSPRSTPTVDEQIMQTRQRCKRALLRSELSGQ